MQFYQICFDFQANNVVLIPSEQQMIRYEEAKTECFRRTVEDPYPRSGDLYCNRTWDNVMCWPDVPAGQLSFQSCPRYINMFRTDAFASRYCQPNGTWFIHPILNRTWTNYTDCVVDNFTNPTANPNFRRHVNYIKTIYHVGYGLSVITLIAAIFIMLHFKKLRCSRNTLHVNLFASFIVRATLSFLRESLLVSGLGLPKDIYRSANGSDVLFRDDVSHWECRLFMAVFNYAISTNYMWIFVEGLYLHTLIFMEMFLETSCVTWYIVFGWTASLTFVLPWVVARKLLENIYCWNTHPTPGYFWIIKTPISISVLINFILFLNIVRALFTKLNAMNTPESQRHRKLAKSTLVLIPLFGVPYIVFLGLPDNMNDALELVKLYFEMTFNSFNGLVVAMLFCFLNGEVQNEFQQLWQNRQLRKAEFRGRRFPRFCSTRTAHSSPKPVNHLQQQQQMKPQTTNEHSQTEATLEESQETRNKDQRKDRRVLIPMAVDKEHQLFLNSSEENYF